MIDSRRRLEEIHANRMRKHVPGVRTWGEIKMMAREAGVADDDLVFMVDIGPNVDRIYVSRDINGFIEIGDCIEVFNGNNPD
jgi:hypothetical protein